MLEADAVCLLKLNNIELEVSYISDQHFMIYIRRINFAYINS